MILAEDTEDKKHSDKGESSNTEIGYCKKHILRFMGFFSSGSDSTFLLKRITHKFLPQLSLVGEALGKEVLEQTHLIA